MKYVPYHKIFLSGLSEPSGRKLRMPVVGIFSFTNLTRDGAIEKNRSGPYD
jgi:hypothetical protein